MNFSTRLSQPGGASPYGRSSDFPTHTKRIDVLTWKARWPDAAIRCLTWCLFAESFV